jgi:thiosulfate dehydrogenase [quinone] large subunit
MRQDSRGIEQTAMGATPAAPALPGRTAPLDSAPKAQSAVRSLSRESAAKAVWAVARLCLGWTFLWPFFDKMFGLGHETPSAQAWISGGNPTKGFLSGSIGPFSGIYHNIAGAGIVNVLFMVGLLVIGTGLLLGIYMRFACAAGVLMLLLMWSASLPPANDVFMDDHIIYALLLGGLALVGAGRTLGLGRWWAQTSVVRRYSWLS